MNINFSQRLLIISSVALFLTAPLQFSYADSLISFELEKAEPESDSLLKLNSKKKIFELKKSGYKKSIPPTKIVKELKENKKAILILDASGSMWGKIDGKPKIEIAKEVVGTTIKDWTEKVDLGLIAYGHNHKGDCSDIEMLIEPSKLNVEAYMAQANKLNPKGKTPLTAAVVKAAEALKYSEEKATVILVSDGKETCDLDPCLIGETLEERGIDFTAHVIGFDVSVEDSAGLRCMAEKTGGVYLDAKNAEDLQEAMNATREATIKVESEQEPEPEKIDHGIATLIVPDEVVAGSEFPVKWSGPKNQDDYLIIRSENTDLNTKSYSSTKVGGAENVSPTAMNAPEKIGLYVVHYEVSTNHSIGQAILKVIPPKATVETPQQVAAGSTFEIKWSGPLNDGDSLRMFKANGDMVPKWVSLNSGKSESPASIKAPVELGDYEIRYVGMHGQSYANSSFTVTEVMASVDAPESVAAGGEFEVVWTGPKNEFDRLKIFDAEGKDTYQAAPVYKKNDMSPALLTAPVKPGTYTVRYMVSNEKSLVEDTFEVIAVAATINVIDEIIEADTKFKVNWTGPKNKTDQLRIYTLDGKNKNRRASVGKKDAKTPAEIRAPRQAGEYEIRYVTTDGKVLAVEKITVEPKPKTKPANQEQSN